MLSQVDLPNVGPQSVQLLLHLFEILVDFLEPRIHVDDADPVVHLLKASWPCLPLVVTISNLQMCGLSQRKESGDGSF